MTFRPAGRFTVLCDHRRTGRQAMESDQTDRAAAMRRLEAFIGEWVMAATFPGGQGGTGRAVFEWALDRQFLICHTEVPGAPNALMIMGYDGGRLPYHQHYFDSRGVARIYAMDLSDGVWTLLRDSADFTPLEFAQRYTGTISADSRRIDGRWETARDGSAWELDFQLNYAKAG
jgi:hypothetical protein